MPHPNAVLPCPSESARRRHAAHGETCPVCDTTSSTGQASPRTEMATDLPKQES